MNLAGPQSRLFYSIPPIRDMLMRHLTFPLFYIIECVVMGDGPRKGVSETLGARPTVIDAAPVCAAGRKRLFWFNFEI